MNKTQKTLTAEEIDSGVLFHVITICAPMKRQPDGNLDLEIGTDTETVLRLVERGEITGHGVRSSAEHIEDMPEVWKADETGSRFTITYQEEDEPNEYVLCWRCQSSIVEDENPQWEGKPVCHDDYRELCSEQQWEQECGSN